MMQYQMGILIMNFGIKIESFLIADKKVHINIINYWACDDDDLDDSYDISPYIRKLKSSIL